ncbi:hypothetical protein F5887DRAFT_540577 [Amanita rubescens]|nr:hypothetical protein F5887DRAFT_540577 [Amanita rubescens]
MALQLPPPPRDPDVPLPPAPAHPPTLANIYEARRYTNRIITSKSIGAPNCATIDDVGRAVLYESSAVQIASAAVIGPAVAPPWFGPVQQQLNNMQQAQNNMQQQLNNVQQEQNNIRQQLNRIDSKASRALNATNGEGTFLPFETVLFVDGTDPTAPPHNLPALTSTAIIDALQGVEATDYLNGYGIAVPHLIVERLCILKAYIGCRQL